MTSWSDSGSWLQRLCFCHRQFYEVDSSLADHQVAGPVTVLSVRTLIVRSFMLYLLLCVYVCNCWRFKHTV